MQVAQQPVEEITGPLPGLATETGRGTGVPQCVPQNKKPSFKDDQDLRLQAAEALVFVREMSPDLSGDDLFYIERAIDILNRLVDEDHADRLHFWGGTD